MRPTSLRFSVVAALLCIATSARSQMPRLESPEKFKVLVEYTDTVAKCDTIRTLGPIREGEHGFLLRFGPNAMMYRSVGAVWDTAGRVRTYSDVRGEVRLESTPSAERGPETRIMIAFPARRVLATNREHGTDRGSLLVLDESLRSANLGSPLVMLARLHRQCGAPVYEPYRTGR